MKKLCNAWVDVNYQQIHVLNALFSGQDLSSTRKEDLAKKNEKLIADNRTETIEESLENSLFKHVDMKNASEAGLTEAFCRDIDAFNEAFQVNEHINVVEKSLS